MGAYGPLNAYARDQDCYSAWYSWGVSAIEFSIWFDAPFEGTAGEWIAILIKMGVTGVLTFDVPYICIKELNKNKKDPWHDNFGFLTNDISLPIIGAASDNDDFIKWTVFQSITLFLVVWQLYGYWVSGFYYWGLGLAMGSLVSNIFVSVDYWADLGIITPTPAHIRYFDS